MSQWALALTEQLAELNAPVPAAPDLEQPAAAG
jgi:hypothetical protein